MLSFTTFLDCGDLGQREADVEYEHHRGYRGDRETPDEPEWCEVTKITCMGADVTDYIARDTWESLCGEALDAYQGN